MGPHPYTPRDPTGAPHRTPPLHPAGFHPCTPRDPTLTLTVGPTLGPTTDPTPKRPTSPHGPTLAPRGSLDPTIAPVGPHPRTSWDPTLTPRGTPPSRPLPEPRIIAWDPTLMRSTSSRRRSTGPHPHTPGHPHTTGFHTHTAGPSSAPQAMTPHPCTLLDLAPHGTPYLHPLRLTAHPCRSPSPSLPCLLLALTTLVCHVLVPLLSAPESRTALAAGHIMGTRQSWQPPTSVGSR